MSLPIESVEAIEYLSHEQLVLHLTALGWDPEGEKSELRNRLQTAILHRDDELTQISRSRSRGFSFVNACSTGDLKLIELCLGYGVDVNTVFKGLSGLHKAALKGQVEVVRLLLRRGAKVDLRYVKPKSIFSCASSSPLDSAMHIAAQQLMKSIRKVRSGAISKVSIQYQEVMVTLLEAGAGLNLKNKAGLTPIDILGKESGFLLQAADRWKRWQYRRSLVLMLYGCSIPTVSMEDTHKGIGRGMVAVLMNPDLALQIMRFNEPVVEGGP